MTTQEIDKIWNHTHKDFRLLVGNDKCILTSSGLTAIENLSNEEAATRLKSANKPAIQWGQIN